MRRSAMSNSGKTDKAYECTLKSWAEKFREDHWDMNKEHPYRLVATRKEQPSAPKFGMIRAPKPEKPKKEKLHKCRTPAGSLSETIGLWRLFWALVGKPLYRGTIWHCQCGTVWMLGYYYKVLKCGWKWDEMSIEYWLNNGGVE
jgi:hypothetical protein